MWVLCVFTGRLIRLAGAARRRWMAVGSGIATSCRCPFVALHSAFVNHPTLRAATPAPILCKKVPTRFLGKDPHESRIYRTSNGEIG